MNCRGCGTENRPGRRFCAECGAPLELSCLACGAANEPGDKFCGQCGSALVDGVPAATSTSVSERRLVSVLFADLVGFTTLSEHRDPEEVRELLSRYFDSCRTLIERYGGTVEKFIGDAVMAVWGTPIAREDDPERAVRAGLHLTQLVPEIHRELRVRVGILTGNAAVAVGAEAEGMVLGDTVNTASRLQSIAPPGTVLVDDVTRRASEAAIAYEDAGVHEVKGREQPVHAWRPLRVVAGVGGARRTAGLEVPFVGRDRELSRIIEVSEESASSGRARLVAVVGEAGTGKSRLLWEYYKYVDGVEKLVRWHQGRCLSYGEGVGYWALAEMVRARAGIVEEEDAASARAKLKETVEQFIPEEMEQRLVEPRLAHLLGLEQRTATDRADLFSGWRLFFERLSDDAPVVMAFEDLQWADSGLLEFIDYLLEWSANRPLFVLGLGRPELLAQRPRWDAIRLAAIPDAAMRQALAGLVPGLPEELTARILRRAEGVPLYAVETVRMLLDRGLLAQEGARYVPIGDVGELDVPETLHALAAARLDGLTAVERAVLQDASVYGQSFAPAGVAALGTRGVDDVQQILDGLVAKQILGLNDDPLSAERGQYNFLQGLLRTTAYGTLSRRDRKERHLAVARHLQEAWGEGAPELAEVLAAHFLDAAEAEPDASDAAQIRAMACDTLAEAGRRALSLALGPEAQRAFDRGAELAEDGATRAALLHQAGQAAVQAANYQAGRERLDQAVALFEALGDPEASARSMVVLADALSREDRLEEAIELNRRAVSGLSDGSSEKASALASLSVHLAFRGDLDEAFEAADAALAIAEPSQEWLTVCYAFTTLSYVRHRQGRSEEAIALRERCLSLALEHELGAQAVRAHNNLADLWLQQDRFGDALTIIERGLALAQSRGDRRWEQALTLNATTARIARGDWEQLPPVADDGLPAVAPLFRRAYLPALARIQAARGDIAAIERTLRLAETEEDSINLEYAAGPNVARAIVLNGLGRHAEALEAAMPIATGSPAEIVNEDRREAYLEAGHAALALDDPDALETLISFANDLPPAQRSPLIRAGAARFEGLLAARRDDSRTAQERLSAAIRELRAIDAPFVLAQVLLEQAELRGDADEAEEAQAIFERLRATPWLERCGRCVADAAVRA
ncbi:MAG TPA: adenylate/guanylate cyclase domain-containing protein [Solirubrobacteraceae bacterium]|jgi:class 3 adenylate cyclase/tetratricopeptide (TPR) repeat protein|nr:adenylate/guanylate cyclase domain-containing protein [Solirubrobacteraceae bacterium]